MGNQKVPSFQIERYIAKNQSVPGATPDSRHSSGPRQTYTAHNNNHCQDR